MTSARTGLARVSALTAIACALAGCAATSTTAASTPAAAAPTPSATLPPTWGTGPQAPADPNGAPTAFAWSPQSRAAATAAAVKFMGSYARPGTPQPAWSNALAPYSSLELRGVLAGVDTSYLTTGSPAPSGTLQANESDPYNAVVLVGTSEGPWQLSVHRQADGSWLVNAIQPPIKQGH